MSSPCRRVLATIKRRTGSDNQETDGFYVILLRKYDSLSLVYKDSGHSAALLGSGVEKSSRVFLEVEAGIGGN